MLFNLSAIVGSAILYGDFRKAAFHQMVRSLAYVTDFDVLTMIDRSPSFMDVVQRLPVSSLLPGRPDRATRMTVRLRRKTKTSRRPPSQLLGVSALLKQVL